MKKFDAVELWLDNVAFSHSGSENTEEGYRLGLRRFCEFVECTPQEILDEYEGSTERAFKRKWTTFLRAYISELSKPSYDYTPGTIQDKVSAVKSFFKYNDLPLGFLPLAQKRVVYHNRDITKREILAVIKISNLRDQAFYAMATQSGLSPGVLCKLKVKNIEPDFSKGIMPCCIRVPQELAKGKFGAYFSFMGEESVKYLREYFRKRVQVGPEDYIFTKRGTDQRLQRKSITNLFMRSLETLKANGTISFEQVKPGKHRELRLYCLRKYFRNKNQAGVDYKNFWMGHKTNYKAPHIPASDDHYFSRTDIEFHRKLYRDNAMSHLRLESETPSEMEQTIIELRSKLMQREKTITTLSERLDDLEKEQKSTRQLLEKLLKQS